MNACAGDRSGLSIGELIELASLGQLMEVWTILGRRSIVKAVCGN